MFKMTLKGALKESFLEARASLELSDKRSQTPLLCAAASGSAEAVRLLCQGGAELGVAGAWATMYALEARRLQ